MTGYVILGALLVLLVLFLTLPVGAAAVYSPEEILVKIRIGPVRLKLYPPKERGEEQAAKKRAKKKKKEPRPPSAKALARRAAMPGPMELLEPGLEALGAFRRSLTIDTLHIDYLAAGADPAGTALQFGGISAALGIFQAGLENLFRIRDRRIRAGVDFEREKPEIRAALALFVRVGPVLGLSLRFLWIFFRLYREKKAALARDPSPQPVAVQ